MKIIKTYNEFLNLTVDEANDLVHDAMNKQKFARSQELARWIAQIQTEHIFNHVKYKLEDCETLYKFARGDRKTNTDNKE